MQSVESEIERVVSDDSTVGHNGGIATEAMQALQENAAGDEDGATRHAGYSPSTPGSGKYAMAVDLSKAATFPLEVINPKRRSA